VEIIKVRPRGYCYGVVDAMQIAKTVAKRAAEENGGPVYILGLLIHNRHALEELDQMGVKTLDGEDRLALLDQVPPGATVIFTAHGVAPAVREKARERNLTIVDATCPDVTRTHDLARELTEAGYDIIYIGKRGHPEPAGVIGEAPDRIHLVERPADLANLPVRPDRVAVLTQTTLSLWDTEELIRAIREVFPLAVIHRDICLATQTRQEAAVKAAQDADLVIVVGDTRSNNSMQLVRVVEQRAGKPAYLIDTIDQLDYSWLAGKERIAVTAGASTPSQLTREVIQALEAYAAERSRAKNEAAGQPA
jgi:4-hydroxy-3-methylbut-2-enyl diphosphate reductase